VESVKLSTDDDAEKECHHCLCGVSEHEQEEEGDEEKLPVPSHMAYKEALSIFNCFSLWYLCFHLVY